MENETITEDARDLLTQSYCEGVKRITGYRNSQFVVPEYIVKKRKQYWDGLFYKYSIEYKNEIELDINTLEPCEDDLISVVQYWVNTSYLPYNAFVNKVNQSECNELKVEISTTASTQLLNTNENLEKCGKRQIRDKNSSLTSVDTAIYIKSNKNTTSKEETMAIVEGAKHDTVTKPQKVNCENTGTMQFATGGMPGNRNKNVILDNNDNNCHPLRCSPETLKDVAEENNLEKDINKTDSVTDRNSSNIDRNNSDSEISTRGSRNKNSYTNQGCLSARHREEASMIPESFISQNSTTKLSHRKKLYSDRDSPVDLVHATRNSRNTIFDEKSHLHPGLDAGFKKAESYRIHKKRRITQFNILTKNMNSSKFSFVSPRVRKKRRATQNHFNDSCSTLSVSKKSRSLFPVSIMNNLIEKQSSVRSTSTRCMDTSVSSADIARNTKSKKETELNNSIVQTEKFNDRQQHEVSNNKGEELRNIGPIVHLRQSSESSIQTNAKSSETGVHCRRLSPVICLKQLSASDIQKYKKPNKTETCQRLNPVVRLKQLSESDIQKYRNSNKTNRHRTNLDLVVCLKQLSEFDIQTYKKIDKTMSTGLHNLNPMVQLRKDEAIWPQNSKIPVITVEEDTESDESTLLMVRCRNSDQQSDSTKIIEFPSSNVNTFNDCNFKHKTGVNKENKDLGNNVLSKKLEQKENGYCTYNKMNSYTNTFRTQHDNNAGITEEAKNLTNMSNDKITVLRKSTQNQRFLGTCRNDYKKRKRESKDRKAKFRTHYFKLFDEDEGFMDLIHDTKSNSMLCKKVPCENSNDLVGTENVDSFEDLDKEEVNDVRNNNGPNGVEKSKFNQLLHQSIAENANFEKKGKYLNRLRNSNTQSQVNEEENINHVNYLNARHPTLLIKHNTPVKLSKSQRLLKKRKQLLINTNIKKINPTLLRFQTKIFDSDSESSHVS